jgi:carboxypeptidase C (cathepsin A)
LGYKTDTVYTIINDRIFQMWEWERGHYPDTSEALRSAMAKNPFMKVFVAQGYYDLATPHFAAEYSLSHMDIDPEVRDNVTMSCYEAGHVFYRDMQSLTKFRQDIEDFMNDALGKR